MSQNEDKMNFGGNGQDQRLNRFMRQKILYNGQSGKREQRIEYLNLILPM